MIISIPAAPLTKSSSVRLEHAEQAIAICGAVEIGVYFDKNSWTMLCRMSPQENRPDADPANMLSQATCPAVIAERL